MWSLLAKLTSVKNGLGFLSTNVYSFWPIHVLLTKWYQGLIFIPSGAIRITFVIFSGKASAMQSAIFPPRLYPITSNCSMLSLLMRLLIMALNSGLVNVSFWILVSGYLLLPWWNKLMATMVCVASNVFWKQSKTLVSCPKPWKAKRNFFPLPIKRYSSWKSLYVDNLVKMDIYRIPVVTRKTPIFARIYRARKIQRKCPKTTALNQFSLLVVVQL